MKYKASRDLPQFVEEYKTVSPSKLADIILKKRNAKVKPQSVTMWFKRHRETYDKLNEILLKELPSEMEAVEDGIFGKKNFRQLSSVKKWVQVLQSRELY